jgi:O-antigen polymerase
VLQKRTTNLPKAFLAMLGFTFLCAMNFFMQNPGNSGLTLPFNTTTWLSLSIVLGIGLFYIAKQQQLKYNHFSIGLLLSCILLTLPLFYPQALTTEAQARVVGLWAGWLFLLVLQQFTFKRRHICAILAILLLSVWLQALFAYVQFLLLEPGNIFAYNINRSVPYGIFQQTNVLASFLALGLPLAAYLLVHQPNSAKLWQKISYLTPVLIVPLLIVLSSRTGWLVAIIASLLCLPPLYSALTKSQFIRWFTCIATGSVIGYVLVVSVNTATLERLQDKTQLNDIRSSMYRQSIDMIKQQPVLGYGYGRYEAQYMHFTAQQHQLNPHYKPGLANTDHPHNEILLWVVEGGIISALAILFILALIIKQLLYAQSGNKLLLLALLTPIGLHSQLELPFYHSAVHWLIFVIILFVINHHNAVISTYKLPSFSIIVLRLSSLILPIVTISYMLSTLYTNMVLTRFEATRPIDISILENITNHTTWRHRIEWDVNITKLKIGIATGNNQLINEYIAWSLALIKYQPRPAIYQNLISAYSKIKQTKKADEIRQQAKFLFPDKVFN